MLPTRQKLKLQPPELITSWMPITLSHRGRLNITISVMTSQPCQFLGVFIISLCAVAPSMILKKTRFVCVEVLRPQSTHFILSPQHTHPAPCQFNSLIMLGLKTCQHLWVILCPFTEKVKKEIEEMKERDRSESEETETFPLCPYLL